MNPEKPDPPARLKIPQTPMPYTVAPARQVTLLLGPCQQLAVTETVSPRANSAVTATGRRTRPSVHAYQTLLPGDANGVGREREDETRSGTRGWRRRPPMAETE